MGVELKMLNNNIKKFLVILVTTVFMVSSVNIAAANLKENDESTIYLTYTFDTPEIEKIVVSEKTYSVLTMDGCRSIDRVGVPDLPMKVAMILLPPKNKIKDITVKAYGAQQIPITNDIKLGNHIYYTYALDESDTGLVFATDKDGYTRLYSSKDFSPDKVTSPIYYDKNSVYPGKFFDEDVLDNKAAFIQYKRGYPILLLPLYPVQYNGAKSSITYYDRLDVQIKLEYDYSLQLNEHYRGFARDAALVAEIVDNPSTLDAYNSFNGFGTCSETKEGDSRSEISDPNENDPPTDATNSKNPYGDLLIITTEDLYNVKGPYNLQALATAHKAEGVDVSILTYENIYGNYIKKLKQKLGVPKDRHIPADIPDWKILQNKIEEAYLRGTDYVLIVGDDNWPWQMINTPFFTLPMREFAPGKEFNRGGYGSSLSDPCVPTKQVVLYYLLHADLTDVEPLEPGIPAPADSDPTQPPAQGPEVPSTPDGGEPIEPDIPDNGGEPIEPDIPLDPGGTGENPSIPNENIEVNSEKNNEDNDNLFTKTKLYNLLNKIKESSFIDLLIQKIKLFFNKLADIFSEKQTPSDNKNDVENRDDTNEKRDNDQNLPALDPSDLDPSEIYVFASRGPVQAERVGKGSRWERIPVTTSSDVPYACLDFNCYPEEDDWGTLIITEDDYFAEVYVGRAPVETEEELRNFVHKTINYLKNEENNLDCLMVGEYTGFGFRLYGAHWLEELIGYQETATFDWNRSKVDPQTFRSRIVRYPLITQGIDPSIYTIHRLYDKPDKPEIGTGPRWRTSDFISRVNDGKANILNHVGHANALSCMRCKVTYSIDTVTGKIMSTGTNFDFNNDEYGIWYSVGCFANAYDFPIDCISEWFMVKKSGGAAAFVGNSWYGYAGGPLDPSARYHREFWDAVFGEGKTTFGCASQDSKEDNVQYIGLYESNLGPFGKIDIMKFLYYGINLCGDPVLKIKGV